MPLLYNGDRVHVPTSTREFYRHYPHLKEAAHSLKSKPACKVDPKGLLYVQQREFAVTSLREDASVTVIGSDDATTCHLVVLRHTGSGATCLAHCDGSDTANEVAVMMTAVKSLSAGDDHGRFELHLVGGFIDQRWLSHRLTLQLLETFNNQSQNIHLITCCATELNDVVKKSHHCPAIYGIAVDVKNGEIFHATFPEKGPDEDIRSARAFMGGLMLSIYDAKTHQMQIGPYEWTHFPDAEFWLQQSDAVILQNMSTSPFVEPPHFVKHIKSTLQFLKDHPVPDDSLFPNNRSRIYKKNAQGLWERIDGQASA